MVMLKNQTELDNTRAKLAMLESRYEALRIKESKDEELREMSMQSLKRLINQLKEEIIRYEVASRS
jgi:hypothetical protein